MVPRTVSVGGSSSVAWPCGPVTNEDEIWCRASAVKTRILTGSRFGSGECHIQIAEKWWANIGALCYIEGIENVY